MTAPADLRAVKNLGDKLVEEFVVVVARLRPVPVPPALRRW
jgi:hypothetical protein